MSKHVVTPVRVHMTVPCLSLVYNPIIFFSNLFSLKRDVTVCNAEFFKRHNLSNGLSTSSLVYVTPGNFSSFYSLGPAAGAAEMHRLRFRHTELY